MRNGRSGGIRTPGPLVPNQMRYQAALHSDALVLLPTLPIGKLIKHTKCRRCGFSCQSGCNPAGNSRRAADLIPCLATLPPFNSSTKRAGAADRRDSNVCGGTFSIALTSCPLSSKNSISSGIRVFFIQKLRIAFALNTNNIPSSSPSAVTNIKPYWCCIGVIATSTVTLILRPSPGSTRICAVSKTGRSA